MMGSEPSLVEITLPDGRTQLGSPKPCSDIQSSFANLKFNIHQNTLEISPMGYLYMSDSKCFVGIESIDDL